MSTQDRVLRKPEVMKVTGLGSTTIWREVKAKRFPSPVRITEHRVGWLQSDIDAWLANRPKTRAA